ncbi:MAG: folate-binding protein [Propionibacteriaceae bacterium]|nr:folate-binding protein [Propionibacteriaceae bacterium]
MSVLVEGGIDDGLVWHHGTPVVEGRAVEAGTAVVDLANRDVIQVLGPDRLGWLHSLTSQHLSELAPGVPVEMLVLSPQGHIEHVLSGIDDGERFVGWTEPGRGAALVDFLERMRFMMRVEVSPRDDLALAWVGDQVALPEQWVSWPWLGGRAVLRPRDEALPEGVMAGTWGFEAHRIAAGVPRVFVDTDHRTIPNEIGLFGTHLDKGCYRGQETVARVHTLGRPPRRLVLLHLDGSAEALPGLHSSLVHDGREVGFVGAAARHHELGPIALGLVKRNVPVEATLTVDGIAAAQEVLVDPEVGLHVRPRLG